MADTARNELVLELAELLEDHNVGDPVVLDIHEQSGWTDLFVIATVSSQAHMRGLVRYVHEFLNEKSIIPYHRRKRVEDDGWTLIDCGDFVVHLMTQEQRDFYELERLWYGGRQLFHSSKSS